MWIIFALSASLFWGVSYVLSEQIYKKISVFTSLGIAFLVVSIISIVISYFNNSLKSDLVSIYSSKNLLWYVIGGIVALMIAESCIGLSIVSKNATLAGLIEISYPIFIAIFSYLLFNNKVTLPTILGGIMIFLGVFVIYYFNH
ncbi:MAG: DMT family transporter [Candidatus Paceibacterota bacterium]|jgi:drug/metabolite transporter (DMT)-like permease